MFGLRLESVIIKNVRGSLSNTNEGGVPLFRTLLTMSSLSKENQEALAQIEKLRAKAWAEQEKENWVEAMHNYEKCAHALVEIQKSTPQSYHRSIQLSFNNVVPLTSQTSPFNTSCL